jgi:hypothetical protein
MKYAILIFDEETAHPSPNPPDPAEAAKVYEEYNAYTQMLRDSGAYLGGEALEPNPTATTIRVRDGQTITTDGPFAETKEGLGGFYLIEARDLNDAIQVAARIPSARLGSVEVRPIMELDRP